MKKEQKHNRIYIRITDTDKANIAYNSELLNISMSEYVLRCVRRKRIVICENFPELLFQLSRIGNNLNQIAVIANTNNYLSEDYISQAKEHLKNCYLLMNKFVSYICEPEENNLLKSENVKDDMLQEIKNALEMIGHRINRIDKKIS